LSRFWYPAMARSPRSAVIEGIPRLIDSSYLVIRPMKRLQIGWVPKGGGGQGKVDAPGAGDAIFETSFAVAPS
jgi:hypothetical protein